MKRTYSFCMLGTMLAAGAAFVGLTAGSAGASTVVLEDLNATARFETADPGGQFTWVVDGVDHLRRQWFWFRVGPTGPEQRVDSLTETANSPRVVDANFNPGNDMAFIDYRDPQARFNVTLGFILTGGDANSRTSDIAETITIKNTSGSPLDFHFFQFVDMNLDADHEDDTVVFEADNTVRQTSGLGTSVSETVITPRASHWEANLAPAVLNSLTNGTPTTLNDNSGPVVGNVGWAFEWDVVIPVRGTFIISKDKQITPEPTAAALLAFAAPMVLRRRRAR